MPNTRSLMMVFTNPSLLMCKGLMDGRRLLVMFLCVVSVGRGEEPTINHSSLGPTVGLLQHSP